MSHGDTTADLTGSLLSEPPTGRDDQTSKQYLRLRADILAGKFPPRGAALHETQLSETYGASRTPIREALNWLAHDGLLERATRGFRVRSGTAEDVIEIYAARVALESEAAGAAAIRHTELDLARLEQLHGSVAPQPKTPTCAAGISGSTKPCGRPRTTRRSPRYWCG